MDFTRRNDCERKQEVRRAMIPRCRSEQWEEERRKGGWQLCWPLYSLREVQQGCWEPQVSQEYACLGPACAQLLAGAVHQKHGQVTNAGWTSPAGLTAVARSIFVAATSTHFNKIPATTLTEPWFSDFNTRGPPYKAERSKYSTPKFSGVGRIFLLSLFIFYKYSIKCLLYIFKYFKWLAIYNIPVSIFFQFEGLYRSRLAASTWIFSISPQILQSDISASFFFIRQLCGNRLWEGNKCTILIHVSKKGK